jgi:hypothetical protein
LYRYSVVFSDAKPLTLKGKENVVQAYAPLRTRKRGSEARKSAGSASEGRTPLGVEEERLGPTESSVRLYNLNPVYP